MQPPRQAATPLIASALPGWEAGAIARGEARELTHAIRASQLS
ncbi:hypothetical protein SALB1_2642 [Salinisphaera sp. LB1]|nr:hypothetical protein SALB1_2642 [Salinisphaera sp. LB1]